MVGRNQFIDEEEKFDPTTGVAAETFDPTAAPVDQQGVIGDEPVLADPQPQVADAVSNQPEVIEADVEEPQESQGEEGADLFSLSDVLLAPIRGTESAVRDIYSLLDFVSGDNLPDLAEERVFGQAHSAIGGFLTEAVNFAWGFVPVAGQLGKVGKIGSAINLTTKAQRAARIAGKTKTAFGIRLARDTVAGAVVDWSFYEEGEERLSNMIQSSPELANPITEFLAAEEDETEAEARFKQALEGSVMGLGVDLVTEGLKSLRGLRRIRDANGSIDDAQQFLEDRAESMNRAILDPSGQGLQQAPAERVASYSAQNERHYRTPLTPEEDQFRQVLCTHS